MFCSNCGKPFATDANFCSSCGAVIARQFSGAREARITRPRIPRMLAGVCSGIAIYYGWDIALVRILLVVFTIITGGLGIILYVIAWILMPDALYALPVNSQRQESPV